MKCYEDQDHDSSQLQTTTHMLRNHRSLDFSIDLNPSSRTMALGPTQRLTEMSTRSITGGKVRPALLTNNLTAIYQPII
jgi:hypothetical protein